MTPDVRNKLSKLIPMLSSDNEGEIVNAARAIVRTLKSSGLTIHDLNSSMLEPKKKIQHTSRSQAIIHVCNKCLWAGILNKKEATFIKDIMVRVSERPYYTFTPKQADWFSAIANKCGINVETS